MQWIGSTSFQLRSSSVTVGNARWNALEAPDTQLYPWDQKSTYIKSPPFFEGMVRGGVGEGEGEWWGGWEGGRVVGGEEGGRVVGGWKGGRHGVYHPPSQTKDLPPITGIFDAAVLLNLGDSMTTDHISPAGSISRTSPAARYLASRGYASYTVFPTYTMSHIWA